MANCSPSNAYFWLFALICLSMPTQVTAGTASPPDLVARNETSNGMQGWTTKPSGRATLDIFWSCASTIFLCSWSILCLNVPGRDDTAIDILWRRLWLTNLCLLGPEFTCMQAMGEYLSARRSVKAFREAGFKQWKLAHAFFADAGGIVLHTPDFKEFPIDSQQVLYLVKKGYLAFPDITDKEIDDKNKVDLLLRSITVLQTVWFLVNVICRAVQGLAITTLELTVSAFIFCTFATVLCWLKKPADVQSAIHVHTTTNMVEILTNAEEAADKTYYRTPLDFVSRKEWPWSLLWQNWINIIRHMHITFAPKSRPVDRFENSMFRELNGWAHIGVLFIASGYFSIFFAAWNYGFPTAVERTLWRVACIASMACLAGYGLLCVLAFPSRREPYKDCENETAIQHQSFGTRRRKELAKQHWFTRFLLRVAASCRNNSVLKDPELDVPLRAILPSYVLGFVYCHARAYIYLSDIIGLRSIPASAYQDVDWSWIMPSFR